MVSEGPVVKLECEREKLDEFRRKYPFIEDGGRSLRFRFKAKAISAKFEILISSPFSILEL